MTRVLTWSTDNTARIWSAATGAQIGPALTHDNHVSGAAFSKDETHALTWSRDNTGRLWNVRWAMRDAVDPDFVADICREKLVGSSGRAGATPSTAQVFVGVRYIDARDTAAAPILRGREGENVCVPPPTSWETLLSLLRSPAR